MIFSSETSLLKKPQFHTKASNRVSLFPVWSGIVICSFDFISFYFLICPFYIRFIWFMIVLQCSYVRYHFSSKQIDDFPSSFHGLFHGMVCTSVAHVVPICYYH